MNSNSTEITEIKDRRSPDYPGGSAVTQPLPVGAAARPGFQTAPFCQTEAPAGGWILYDGECRYCIAAAKRFNRVFVRRGFSFLPLQTGWVQKQLGLKPGTPLQEMRVLTRDGRDFGGADAVIFLARQIWRSRPLALLAQLPGIQVVVDRAYRWIAAHRGCTHISAGHGVCSLRESPPSSLTKRVGPWMGVILFPILALFARNHIPPWLFMWLMAVAIFLGCKWLTLWRAKPHSGVSPFRVLGYLFMWPGMDAPRFLDARPAPVNRTIETRRTALAIVKVFVGAALLFGLARHVPNELGAGWVGMIGMVLILHFGLFDLAAVVWRTAGIDAKPIMSAPLKSTSLSEFWGRRWNGAFNQLVLTLFFRRLVRFIGSIRATLTAFLLSGLIHELVISLPAAAGYGLPTAYFLLQGWGVVAQRSSIGEQLGIGRGLRGRAFTMLIAGGPVFWLFHPPFVRNVILPFMKAIGAQ
jgi:predicted DCC family thiol-disulfide oxidoreductase YuxK